MVTIEEIHNSLINGQRRQMTEQIDEYGSDFWGEYKDFLNDTETETTFHYFSDACISYHMIKKDSMYLDMQYYMEYCQLKGYVTPQEWLKEHKHY